LEGAFSLGAVVFAFVAMTALVVAFFFGDQWGRESAKRQEHFRAVVEAEQELEVARNARAEQTTPGWIYVVVLVVLGGALWKIASLGRADDWHGPSDPWADWPED
jgi:uncharacterized membrane protein